MNNKILIIAIVGILLIGVVGFAAFQNNIQPLPPETADEPVDSVLGNTNENPPNTPPGVDDTFISWPEAKNLIETCKVKMVMQLHNLNVYLNLLDGRRVTTVESRIDEVIKVTQSVSDKCGTIPIATE